MIDERLQEQASLYALGALSAEETRAFEMELSRNNELTELVAKLREAAEALAGTAPLVNPPPALRRKILVQIETEEKIVSLPIKQSGRNPVLVWLPWAIAACFAVIAIGNWTVSTRLHDDVTKLAKINGDLDFTIGQLHETNQLANTRIAELDRMAAELQKTTNEMQMAIAQLRETNQLANTRIAMLSSLLADQPKAIAVSLWDEKNQNGVFVVENLKPLPEDKDYQLWVIDPQYGSPVDAGIFKVGADGKVRIEFKTKLTIKTANKFAVTEEKKGGSPTPSLNQMVMIGG